jgi:hypothetical protein
MYWILNLNYKVLSNYMITYNYKNTIWITGKIIIVFKYETQFHYVLSVALLHFSGKMWTIG